DRIGHGGMKRRLAGGDHLRRGRRIVALIELDVEALLLEVAAVHRGVDRRGWREDRVDHHDVHGRAERLGLGDPPGRGGGGGGRRRVPSGVARPRRGWAPSAPPAEPRRRVPRRAARPAQGRTRRLRRRRSVPAPPERGANQAIQSSCYLPPSYGSTLTTLPS